MESGSALEDMVVRMQLESFYRGKAVLVTGHTGFKGGWLAVWLKAMGTKVSGLALPAEHGRNSFFSRARVAQGMDSVIGDVQDFDSVLKTFKRHRPQIVFHCAAQALVLRSYRDPVETYGTNVMGSVHVLEAARRTPSVRAIVIVTSDKCYENRNCDHTYSEEDAMGGFDPYSSSKGCAELVTAAYRRSFAGDGRELAIASARAGNVIGGGDWARDRLIPDLVRGISRGEVITIRHPRAVRPWQHVLDPLRGYLMLAERLWENGNGFAEAWNFGPHETSQPVEEVARQLISLWGSGRLKIEQNSKSPHEAAYLKLDCTKARSLLGWRSLLSLDDALRLTVDWYRTVNLDARQAAAKTVDQIQRYMDLPC